MSKRTRAENEPHRTVRFFLACAGIGLLAGILSGMFGVGGGTVIVPMLVLLLGFDQRRAAGTSLGAIVLTAPVGVVAYALNGSVDWLAGLILAAGAVVGAQIGTWLLPRVSQTALRWAFVAFLLGVIVSLFLVIPSRESVLELSWLSITGLVILGVVTGTVAGLIGVGGGIVVVPTLMLAFGMSDLTARGTSLLMMIPTALSGTAGNLRRQNVDLCCRDGGHRIVRDNRLGCVGRDAPASAGCQCILRRLPRLHRDPDGTASRPRREGLTASCSDPVVAPSAASLQATSRESALCRPAERRLALGSAVSTQDRNRSESRS